MWLVNVKQPDLHKVPTHLHSRYLTYYYVKMLAEVVGSTEIAEDSIYIMWNDMPCGFGAEIDEEAANKLKGRSEVLNVLPDYAFDEYVKFLNLSISRSKSGWKYTSESASDILIDGYTSEDFERPVGESDNSELGYSVSSRAVKFDPDLTDWFISLEKPCGEVAPLLQIDSYVRTLATVVGSEEEAERKIYRIECGGCLFGFGATIDEETANKLNGLPGVLNVFPENRSLKLDWEWFKREFDEE
ncbi:hypothetical protein IFM89_024371 [Coptis chinensis]|uniref:MORF/ORRM1/DAG-like MORF domain-containing protein n=1 Tax=Coptis chinensis TaxID=261450 RepID=A0A835MAK1_9MAGN|nr:hypothetical protein IFM89_024371 [Coptis chinensis]